MNSVLSLIKDKDSFLKSLESVTADHRNGREPGAFQLVIPGIGEVRCTKIIRTFQGKRITFLGRSGTQCMVVKLYYPRWKGYWNWKRSDRGLRAFNERGLTAPGILFSGYLRPYGVYALVIEYIQGGVDLDIALKGSVGNGEYQRLLDDFLAVIARHHEQGIVQEDLNLSNFMVSGGRIYSLDGDLVKSRRWPVGRTMSIRNLAHLFTSKLGLPVACLESSIDTYSRKRNWTLHSGEREDMKDQILRIRERTIVKDKGKAYRTRGSLTLRKDRRSYSVYFRTNDTAVCRDILEAAERSVREGKGRFAYRYGSLQVGFENMMAWQSKGYGPLFMKRMWTACKVWENALMLIRLGMDMPRPVAVVLLKGAPLKWNCFVFFREPQGNTANEQPSAGIGCLEGSVHLPSPVREAVAFMNEMGILKQGG